MCFCLVFLVLCAFLVLVPTGFDRAIYVNATGARARVLATDDSMMHQTGLMRSGEQRCTILVLSGKHKGEVIKDAINMLSGKLEFDKVFTEGDIAWALLEQDAEHDDQVIFANLQEQYRIGKELLLIGLFSLLLLAFSGYTGARTLLSFAFAILAILKFLVPMALKGYSPMLLALLIGNTITVVTLILVAGLSRRAFAAIISAVSCSLLTAFLSWVFTKYFAIHGSVLQWSESLLYSAYLKVDLTKLFEAAVYLGCSGAIIDLSIDISAALDEVHKAKPDASYSYLLKSGLTIGKTVVGSETTILLLAYLSNYLTVMMVYMAQGTPLMTILNTKTIAAEILHTFVGCSALVLVSPMTSMVCARMFAGEKK